MEYHPEKREEILAKRAERELKRKTYYPEPKPTKVSGSSPTKMEARLEQLREMKKEQKSRRSRSDEFLDSEENQKKYGFTTEVVDGIRNIYYDGDINVLYEAMYGPCIETRYPEMDSSRAISLSLFEGELYARLHKTEDEIPVKIKIGTEDSNMAYFAIESEADMVLTQLCLTDPAYYPSEEACRYVIDMGGLSALNRYVRDNFSSMIEEWNRLHPSHLLALDIPLPNYRFLASEAYSQQKKIKPSI